MAKTRTDVPTEIDPQIQVDAYQKAVAADPKDAEAWGNLGILLDDLDRKAEAEEAYRKAVAADPKHAKAWSNLGNLLSDLDRKDEAVDVYQTAVAADPKFVEVWSNLGFLLDELDRKAEAVDAYRKVVEIEPEDANHRNNLAYHLVADLGQIEEALTEVNEAIRIDSRNSYACATLGFIYLEKNDLDRGKRQYERAIKLRDDEDLPLFQKFYYEYGRALSRNGYASLAREHLENAKRIDSTYVSLELIEAELANLP